MGGPVDRGRKTIKKEQDKASPPVAEFEGPHQPLVTLSRLYVFRYCLLITHISHLASEFWCCKCPICGSQGIGHLLKLRSACGQGAGAGKGVLGTNVPLLKEQQETELERGHDLVKVEPPASQPPNKRPRAGMPGSSVPPEDVHMVQEGDRQVSLALHPCAAG